MALNKSNQQICKIIAISLRWQVCFFIWKLPPPLTLYHNLQERQKYDEEETNNNVFKTLYMCHFAMDSHFKKNEKYQIFFSTSSFYSCHIYVYAYTYICMYDSFTNKSVVSYAPRQHLEYLFPITFNKGFSRDSHLSIFNLSFCLPVSLPADDRQDSGLPHCQP